MTINILPNTAKAQGSYNNEGITTGTYCVFWNCLVVNYTCCCEDPDVDVCACDICNETIDCDFGCPYCSDNNETGTTDGGTTGDPTGGGSTTVGGGSTTVGGGSTTGGGTGGSGGSSSITGQVIATKTLQYTGQFSRGRVNPVTLQTTVFDCSAWVYYVILNLNSSLANAMGNNGVPTTDSFRNYINQHGGFRTTNPKVGDLIMWEHHIEIIVEVDGNKFVTHGSRSAGSVPTTMGKSSNGYIWLNTNYSGIDGLGDGAYLGFWTVN